MRQLKALKLFRSVLIAVLAAAVVGTLLNAVTVAVIVSPERLALALMPGRYAVAFALCLLLPPLDRVLRGVRFVIVASLVLALGASLLAKFAFAAAAPWSMVFGFNLVFAGAAVVTYCALRPEVEDDARRDSERKSAV